MRRAKNQFQIYVGRVLAPKKSPKKGVAHQIYRAYARARVSVRTLVCKLECKSRMAAAAPPPPPETAWFSRARGALDIARGALGAGGRVNSIHPRASVQRLFYLTSRNLVVFINYNIYYYNINMYYYIIIYIG